MCIRDRDKELFDRDNLAEARHLHLMQKILGRVEPFVGAEAMDPNFPFPQETKRNYGLIDRICRELVRSMISKSVTNYPSDEDVYYRRKAAEILNYAETEGIEIKKITTPSETPPKTVGQRRNTWFTSALGSIQPMLNIVKIIRPQRGYLLASVKKGSQAALPSHVK